MVVHFITESTNANVCRGSRGERFAGFRCRGTTKVSDEPWNPRGRHTEAGRAKPGLSCIRKTRRVTQFRLMRAYAGPGDDDGAGPGWTVARDGSLRTWNGVCLTAFSGLGRGRSLGRVTKFPCSLRCRYHTGRRRGASRSFFTRSRGRTAAAHPRAHRRACRARRAGST